MKSLLLLSTLAVLALGASAKLGGSTGAEAPKLIGSAWINAEKAIPSLKGKVTILHFWTFACINCKHNLPYYAKWAKAYDPSEVQVVGIHTPELDFERKDENVRAAVKRLGITYPVLIDRNGANWDRYKQELWPTVYVIDKKGVIRAKWDGELQWDGHDGFGQLSQTIEKLRKETP